MFIPSRQTGLERQSATRVSAHTKCISISLATPTALALRPALRMLTAHVIRIKVLKVVCFLLLLILLLPLPDVAYFCHFNYYQLAPAI